MKNIVLLGSTGSIGTQTLDVVRSYKEDLHVGALAAGSSVEKMEQQIREFHPVLASVQSEEKAADLRQRLRDMDIKIVSGMDGLIEVATEPQAEILVTAVVGMLGLRPTVEAIKAKKTIALANKETLVTAGHLIMPLAKECGVPILPVDSEHSAIFQCLQAKKEIRPHKILLTASGGPFRGKTIADLEAVTPAQALAHPTWNMGAKISIDSSTLMNKGLEVIEAHHLFAMPYDQIEVVVQPQSAIHSMVEFTDGSVLAHLGTTDMRIPIQFALSYPERWEAPVRPLDFRTLGSLEFAAPDVDTFRCLSLARHAGEVGGTLPAVMNAANEVAVAAFLAEQIGYLDIAHCVEATMDAHEGAGVQVVESLEQLKAVDAWARAFASEWARGRRS